MPSRRGPRSVASQPVGHAELMSPLPAAAVLSFLKVTRGMPSWNLKDLTKSLRISPAEGKRAIAFLEVQGYIQRTGDDDWLTTDSGTTVSGSKPPRFAPTTAQKSCRGYPEISMMQILTGRAESPDGP